ncbi:MAG: DNA alkylation repair protein [Candidatus Omnitrophota bacterium]
MAAPKKLQIVVKEIREFCLENADEAVVKKYARFFTEGYDAYGLSMDSFMKKKDELIEKYCPKLSLEDAMQLGEMLLESGKYEEASFALYFLDPYADQYTVEVFQRLGRWLESGFRNWGHTDVFCGKILALFFEKEIAHLEDMAEWRESLSKWKRRAVPVTMIDLLKGCKSVKPLLDFIDPMMMDEDRFVQQGIGWFLREAWKMQPEPVEKILLKWKNDAPRKIFQYATEKMSKEQKERFRRERKK